jgi:DnaJ family protein A protein 2
LEALERLLPSKKPDMDPMPEIVDEIPYEEGDIVDVRARSFPAGSDFFDQGFASQFGEGDEDDWEDEDGDDYDDDNMGGEPECRPQ